MNAAWFGVRILLYVTFIGGIAGAVWRSWHPGDRFHPRREYELELRYTMPVPPPAPPAPPRIKPPQPSGVSIGVPERFAPLIQAAAVRHGLDPALIAAVIERESGFDPAARAPDGGRGLMQLMPEVIAEQKCADPFDPARNIAAGSAHLARLRDAFPAELPPETRTAFALAAYNGGLGHVFDARRLAPELQLDPDRWEENVAEAIQFLKFRSFYRRFRHGYCNADLVVAYVSGVLALRECFVKK